MAKRVKTNVHRLCYGSVLDRVDCFLSVNSFTLHRDGVDIMTRILNEYEFTCWNWYQRETVSNKNKMPIRVWIPERIVYCAMTCRNVICSHISPTPIMKGIQ